MSFMVTTGGGGKVHVEISCRDEQAEKNEKKAVITELSRKKRKSIREERTM